MKGDFTRSTFDPENQYTRVRLQQGRVLLDSDFNEQVDIQAHLSQTEAIDVIGACGAPQGNAGFGIGVTEDTQDLTISAGRFYVDGILCELEDSLTYNTQPDFPPLDPDAAPAPPAAGIYLAYLDVWQRHITALEDPTIREVALGGPDTTTRTKTICQVKLLQVGDLGDDLNCLSDLEVWDETIAPSSGQMQARAETEIGETDPCLVPAQAGYRGLENQLYRVEVHNVNSDTEITIKWSRENGSVVAAWTEQDAQQREKLTVSSPGRDAVLGFGPDQWVELTDGARDLQGVPGTLVKVVQVDGSVLTIDTDTIDFEGDFSADHHPKIRRWDMLGESDGEITVDLTDDEAWIPLENGIEVHFAAGNYHTGDYWLIPARTATGDIEWPRDEDTDAVLPQLPKGIAHHHCRLALVSYDDETGFALLEDCRPLFPPLTELTHFFYVGGDGQESLPDNPLPQRLRVAVMNGEQPVVGRTIRFETRAGGRVAADVVDLGTASNTIDLTTNEAGVASCVWQLENDPTTPSQRLSAALLDVAGEATDHPAIIFSGNLSLAREVAYEPNDCDTLADATTVQEALDILCRLERFFYVGGDGQEALPGNPLPQRLRVAVMRGELPVVGRTVRFTTRDGGRVADNVADLATASNTIDLTTNEAGVASCVWQLENDPTNPSQRLRAALLDAAGNATNHPAIDFSGNLSLAREVAYEPGACTELADASTVQEALDILCNLDRGGEPEEEGIHIDTVIFNSGDQVLNDAEFPIDLLASGIQVICDDLVAQNSVQGNPVCYVTLDLPYPFSQGDQDFWSGVPGADFPVIGLQPLILAAQVNSDNNIIFWNPISPTENWLRQQLLPKMIELKRGNRILAHLTLKGNFIRAANDAERYLDGEIFGAEGDGRTALKYPSGNGRRGGDFEMWFWLVEG